MATHPTPSSKFAGRCGFAIELASTLSTMPLRNSCKYEPRRSESPTALYDMSPSILNDVLV